jgi:hypothetical protein
VNTEQATNYLHALMASVTIGVILPGLLLVVLLGFAALVLWRAQSRPDFDIADLLREPSADGSMKVSTWRFASLMAFAIHSAYFYASLFIKPDPELFAWYGVLWGGAPAALLLAEKWNGNLPFAKGPTP